MNTFRFKKRFGKVVAALLCVMAVCLCALPVFADIDDDYFFGDPDLIETETLATETETVAATVTEAETETATEVATDTETETEPVETETATETETETVTETVEESDTDTETETLDLIDQILGTESDFIIVTMPDPVETTATDEGCASAIGVGAIAVLAAVAAVSVLKKKD